LKADDLDSNEVNYSLRIGERLYARIYKHIHFLKSLKIIKNKKDWIEKTILDKLENDEEICDSMSPVKHLSFKILPHIDDKIKARVEVIKQLRGHFSKKQWVLEAIYEKLDKEEKETEQKSKEMIKKLLKTASKAYQPSHELD
jgi:hypothetical protein